MIQSSNTYVLVAGVVTAAALSAFAGAAPQGKMKTVKMSSYASVAGLIKTECASCHNPSRHPEKVDLSSYAALMKSGEHGPIVVAGHPEKSKLIFYVDGTKSPRMPMGKGPLSVQQIASLKAWIKAGARP